jgi:hypothetical protein
MPISAQQLLRYSLTSVSVMPPLVNFSRRQDGLAMCSSLPQRVLRACKLMELFESDASGRRSTSAPHWEGGCWTSKISIPSWKVHPIMEGASHHRHRSHHKFRIWNSYMCSVDTVLYWVGQVTCWTHNRLLDSFSRDPLHRKKLLRARRGDYASRLG